MRILHIYLPVGKAVLTGLAATIGGYNRLFCFTAEVGDYDPKRHPDGYVSDFRLFPNMTPTLEENIVEYHKTLV